MSDNTGKQKPIGVVSPHGETQNLVTALIRETTTSVARRASALAAVDVDGILRRANEPRRSGRVSTTGDTALRAARFRTWVPRVAAAAATLAVVAGTLLIVRPNPLPEGITPPHLIAFVDSLYPESDYVHDQLADVLWPATPEGSGGYLDDVWDTVISGVGEL
jgi:hypothetical protein